MNKKLYVGNLLYEVVDEDLKTLFSQVGNVVSASVIRFQDNGRSKGFGFVEMETEEAAQKAIDTLNGQDFRERKLVVSEAKPPRPKGSFGNRPRRQFNDRGQGRDYGNDSDRDPINQI